MSAFSVEATLRLRDQTAPGLRAVNKAIQGLLANSKKIEGLNSGTAATIRAFGAIDSRSLRSRARAMGTCNAQSLTPLIAAAIAQASSERIAA